MKKAVEYAQMLREAAPGGSESFMKALGLVMQGFRNEVLELAKERHVGSNAGLFGILDEQDRKWRTLVNELGGGILKPDGFMNYMKVVDSEGHRAWMLYRQSLR